MSPSPVAAHKWEFKARFRRNAFGWKSQPAIQRIREAVSEIRKVARRDPVQGAEGAVSFLERLAPALERVDGSSGAIGSDVNRAIEALVPIIARAPADSATREAWLERLWEAHASDEMPYIEALAEDWGELCGSPEVASTWADRLLDTTRRVLDGNRRRGEFFHGTPACLSALYTAGRHEEIVELLATVTFWPYRRWAVKALGAMGRIDGAIRLAESCRGGFASDADVDTLCEDLLLSAGRAEEAYAGYGPRTNRAGTYLATFRAAAKKYPDKAPEEILADLVKTTPGQEGKWFATARQLGLYDTAATLAWASPCDPRTLTRAARDHAGDRPAFAVEAGCAALHWLAQGFGYEITRSDVQAACSATLAAAESLDRVEDTRQRICALAGDPQGFVRQALTREVGPGG